MGYLYDSAEQARLRLSGTLVLVPKQGEAPILAWCQDQFLQGEDGFIYAVNMMDTQMGRRFNCKLNDMDYTTTLSGYWTHWRDDDTPVTTYLSRVPARQQRQGMCRDNMKVSRWDDITQGADISFTSNITTPDFYDQLVLNKYPTLKSLVKRFRTFTEPYHARVFVVAINQDMCVSWDRYLDLAQLVHLGKIVGVCQGFTKSKDISFDLATRYLYLKETLQENGIECH